MRIVLATLGSLGDLHPFLALALGLQARGHTPVLATSPNYRETVEAQGILFAPLRPDAPAAHEAGAMMARIMDTRTGTQAVLDEWTLPALHETCADLTAACAGADLLLNHTIVFPGPLLSEKTGLPFLSVALQPMVLFSLHDAPVPPMVPRWQGFGRLPLPLLRAAYSLGWAKTRRWAAPIDTLRAELGLPPSRKHPLLEGQFSPRGTLALFSSALASPQPDWPPHTLQTGFPFYDHDPGSASPALDAFLAAGEPPLVFTLGSSAVMIAGDFFVDAARASVALGKRAVLLTGRDQPIPPGLPASVLAVPYAPHARLMPRGLVTIHQGGVGTTGQALRAGKPQVIVPFAHDQPDHAARITRYGLGTTVFRDACNERTLTRALRLVLDDPAIAARAAAVGAQVQAEDGVGAACDAVETLF